MIPNTIAHYQVSNKRIPNEAIPNRSELTLCDGENKVAVVRWTYDDAYFWVIQIDVVATYQRRGVATSIYYALADATGLYLKWQPTAWATREMKALARKILHDNDSWNINADTIGVRLHVDKSREDTSVT